MSERKVNQDQRVTENTLSVNRQSELEEEYVNGFQDGKRLDAIEIVTQKKQSRALNKPVSASTLDYLKASRLACLIFEVQIYIYYNYFISWMWTIHSVTMKVVFLSI